MAEQQKIKRISARRLIDRTVKYYLESGDFNGLPLSEIFGGQIQNIEGVKQFLKPLIEAQRITVRCDAVVSTPENFRRLLQSVR
jgi:Tfp pilus assembly PilM family ATPase